MASLAHSNGKCSGLQQLVANLIANYQRRALKRPHDARQTLVSRQPSAELVVPSSQVSSWTERASRLDLANAVHQLPQQQLGIQFQCPVLLR